MTPLLTRRLSIETLERRDLMSGNDPMTPLLLMNSIQSTAAEVRGLVEDQPLALASTTASTPTESLTLPQLELKEYEERMTTLKAKTAVLETAYSEETENVQSLQQTIAQATGVIREMEKNLAQAVLQSDIDCGKLQPTFWPDGSWDDSTFAIKYRSLPDGFDAAIMLGNQMNGRIHLPPGNGSVDFDISEIEGEERNASIVLLRRESNTPLVRTKPFIITEGILWDSFPGTRYDLSPALKSGMDAATFAAQKSSWEKNRVDALSTKAEAQAALPSARDEASKALSSLQEAKREAIPYARIFVTTTAESIFVSRTVGEERLVQFDVQLRSSDTDSRLDVYRDGILWKQNVMRHPEGMQNGHLNYSLRGNVGSGTLSFRYFSGTGTDVKPADRAEAEYNLADVPERAARVGEQVPLETFEAGRLAETPLPYNLAAVRFDGPNAILRFSSPSDQSVIAASTGGIYSKSEQEHEGGMSSGIALITVSPDRSGRYFFGLYDRPGGVERDRVEVNWDANARTLTLANPADQWSVEEATTETQASTIDPSLPLSERIAHFLSNEARSELEQERISLLLDQQKRLTTLSVSDINRQLAEQQGLTLYRDSSLFISVERTHEAVYRLHPEWRPENLETTVIKLWDDANHLVSKGNIRSSLARGIQDTMAGYDQDLAVYEQFTSEIVKKGVEVCMGVKQGLSERALTQSLTDFISDKQRFSAIGRLKGLGIALPDSAAVIEAGKMLYQTHINYLFGVQADNQKLIERNMYLASDRKWQVEHGGLSNVSILARKPSNDAPEEEKEESEARRLARAARLVNEVMKGNDPRAKQVVVVRDEPNLQRTRQLSDGTTEVSISKEEALAVDAVFREEVTKEGGDTAKTADQLVANRELVAMAWNITLDASGNLKQREEMNISLAEHKDLLSSAFTTASESETVCSAEDDPNDAGKYYVEIHSKEIAGGKGSHTFIEVHHDNEVHVFGGRNPNFPLSGPLNVDADNFKDDSNSVWSVRIEPPSEISQKAWTEAVLGAGLNASFNSGVLHYKLLGGDLGITTGNCHVATVRIIRDAGGEILMCLDPPGLEPGLNQY